MCGYCVESAYFERAFDCNRDAGMASPLHYIHLQESPEWFAYHQSCPEDASPVSDMIALCRAWDNDCFRPGTQGPFALKHRMAPDRWDALVQWLHPYAPSVDWEWMLLLVEQVTPNPEAAVQLLSSYCDTHTVREVDWKSRRKGIGDPAALQPAHMFWLYLALILAERHGRLDPILEIAVSIPKMVPGFTGLDLWLQRRAVRACVRSHGTGFLAANGASMRDEVVLSLAMSVRADANYSTDLEQASHKKDEWGL
jgi:hypothetical protein